MESLCIYSSTANDAYRKLGAMVSVGGAKFYKSIKIETIKPNRLKSKHFQTSYTFFISQYEQPSGLLWRCGKKFEC
jgi:hypothetical protein